MKKYIILIILNALFFNLQAQYTLQGTIKDKKNNEPLAGVAVYVQQNKTGVVTDINGHYKIGKITENEIDVSFSYVGYKTIKKHIVFAGNIKTLNLNMTPEVFDLDAVIVSTPFSKLQKDNVMKVSKRTTSLMEQTGVENLMKGIAQIPGVSDLTTGTGINKPVIRGLSGNRVLVYNQGVRLENFQFGEEHGMGIDESGIEAVEVIKGPASLLYGSDALGGVIYLVPEKFARKNKSQLQFKGQYYSNTQGEYGTLGYKKSFDKWQFLMRGAMKQNGDYQFPNNHFAENSANNSKDLKLGIGYLGEKVKTDFRYNFNKQQNGLTHSISNTFNSNITGKFQNLTNQSMRLKNDWKLNKSKLKTNIGFSSHQREVVLNNTSLIGMRLNTLNLDAKWYLPEHKHLESIIGMQGMYQTNHNFGQHFLLPNALITNGGLFGTINYAKNNWALQTGLRIDARNIQTQQVGQIADADYRPEIHRNLLSFTGSLGYKTDFWNHFTARLNLASGFRAPNLAELASKGLHDEHVEIGNPNLKNEQNLQTDFNLSYENTHVEFFANAFFNKLYNYIYLAPTGQTQNTYAVYQYEQNNARLYGGEIGLHFHPHPWDWLHIDTSFETVTGQDDANNYLPLIPADQWKNNLRITKKYKNKAIKRFYVSLSANHTFEANRVSQFENKQPAYTLLSSSIGANFSWKKTDFNLNLSVHNLTDKRYISHLSVLREDNIPNMGRNIVFTVNVKL